MGEFDRYLDLYISEAQEHLATLNRGILELESGGGAEALDAAFRAAHTIKGMAAMMGHDAVARVAHRLEDRLDHVRSGRAEVSPELIDELLAGVDVLSAAIDGAAVHGVPGMAAAEAAGAADGADAADAADAAPAEPDAAGPEAPVPEGTAHVVRVVLAEECLLKAARALVVCRSAARVTQLLGTSPIAFDDAFGGEFWLFIGPGTDLESLEAAIRAAGEVAVVEFRSPRRGPANAPDVAGTGSGGQAEPAGAPGPEFGAAEPREVAGDAATGTAIGARHVRVARSQLVNLADGMGDLAILARRLEAVAVDIPSPALREVVEGIGRRVRDLEATVLGLRMVPAGEVFDRLPRVVRDTARSLGKDVDFRIEGREIELDREILEELVDPLIHILRNSIDHGIEPREVRSARGKPSRGQLVLRVVRERSSVRIEVEDDGGGIARDRVHARARSLGLIVPAEPEDLTDEDVLRLVSQPGFSTADQVSTVSGRGVGLDAVVTRIRSLGGGVALRTVDGKGTTFYLRLPITLTLVQSLRVRVGGEDYAIPLTHVTEAVDLERERVVQKDGREFVRIRGRTLPLVRLHDVLGSPERGDASVALVTELGDRRAALVVDGLVGREQIIVKGFDMAVGTLKIFSGAALLADGRPALVLDPISVI